MSAILKLNNLLQIRCTFTYGFIIKFKRRMSLKLTELVNDFIARKALSKIELDFLESEHWETIEHIDEITYLTSAQVNIFEELK